MAITDKQAREFIDIIEKIASSSADNSQETQEATENIIKYILGSIGGGASGGTTYTNTTPTSASIGGIAAGTTFNAQTIKEMFDALLYPYQVPAFNSFILSGLSSIYELGESIPAGSKIFNWNTTNGSNVDVNTINISENFSSSTILTGSVNDGSETLATSSYSRSIPGSVNLYTISALNTNGGTLSRSISRVWQGRWYYGMHSGTSITDGEITSLLSTGLTSGPVNSYVTLTPSGPQYGYLIIPDYMAQPSDLKNSSTGCFGSNIPYNNIGTTTIVNSFGISQTYNIYRTANAFNSPVDAWMCP